MHKESLAYRVFQYRVGFFLVDISWSAKFELPCKKWNNSTFNSLGLVGTKYRVCGVENSSSADQFAVMRI